MGSVHGILISKILRPRLPWYALQKCPFLNYYIFISMRCNIYLLFVDCFQQIQDDEDDGSSRIFSQEKV